MVSKNTVKKRRIKQELKHLIFDLIFVTIVLAIVVFFGFSFFVSRILIKGDNINSFNGYSAQTIISGSMEPTLSVYDVIVVRPQEKYVMGDIITYYVPDDEGNMVSFTHRIVSVGDGYYRTQGDANSDWDDWTVYEENIVGSIQMRIPKIGKWILNLSKIPLSAYKTAIIIVSSILIVLILVDSVIEASKQYSEKELKMIEIENHQKINLKMRIRVLFFKITRKLKQ